MPKTVQQFFFFFFLIQNVHLGALHVRSIWFLASCLQYFRLRTKRPKPKQNHLQDLAEEK